MISLLSIVFFILCHVSQATDNDDTSSYIELLEDIRKRSFMFIGLVHIPHAGGSSLVDTFNVALRLPDTTIVSKGCYGTRTLYDKPSRETMWIMSDSHKSVVQELANEHFLLQTTACIYAQTSAYNLCRLYRSLAPWSDMYQPYMVTMLRNPMDVFVSMYRYVRRTPSAKHHIKFNGLTLEQLIDEYIQNEIQVSMYHTLWSNINYEDDVAMSCFMNMPFSQIPLNTSSHQLTIGMYESVFKNSFTAIGLLEHVQQSIDLFRCVFPWFRMTSMAHINTSGAINSMAESSYVKSMDKNIYNKLTRLMARDLTIYEAAVNVHEFQLQTCNQKYG
jgi:hypothetical protein